ncbi:MAG: FAD-binding protein [Actinobacteria bacterium ATB1]|nr:FAD-binding protein [Actinobacteria bacterium ATB1]
MRTRRIRNWDRTLSWKPTRIHVPRDTEEVAGIVADAIDRGARVKAIGAALSWSDIAGVPEEVVELDEMSGIAVDVENRRVKVQAGARLRDVNDELARHGLSFENFGSITMQRAGGYTGTGTHGTGGRVPILSSFIEEMTLVDGLGRIRRLSSQSDPGLFSAARVHLGCLGVVTDITFRCVDAFDLEERLEILDFDEVLENLEAYVEGNDYCKLWWLPFTGRVQVYTFNKTTKPRTRLTLQERMDKSGVSGLTYGGLLRLGQVLPGLIPYTLKSIDRLGFKPHVRVDRSDQIIKYVGAIPRHQETEYSIPREAAVEALSRWRSLVQTADSYSVNFTQEVRFVAADDIPMSPASGRDSCYLGGYISSLRWAALYFSDFEALMADYGGRPHWGKTFSRTAAEIRDLYPRYEEFEAQRRKADPAGTFRNSFVDRVFPPD